MKKAILIIGVVIISFVVLDYCELLFPVVLIDGAKVVPFQFRIRDARDGTSVTDVTIKSPVGEDNVDRVIGSVREEADRGGIIRGAIAVGHGWKSTLLFKKEDSLKDRLIEFVFMHPSYQTKTKTFSVKELKKTQTITLQPVEDNR